MSASASNKVNTMFGGPDWAIAFLIVLMVVAVLVIIIYVIANYRRKKNNTNAIKNQLSEYEPVKSE
jgi:uncharacterized membrane protein